MGQRVALGYLTPGDLPRASDLLRQALVHDHLTPAGVRHLLFDDPGPHASEHSLEMQLPFLQRVMPGARIVPLLMSVYGLTEREQDVTRLVLQGDSTAEIAERLVVSAHTVQQHLKRVFDKTGVRSRRDLVGKVFFAHYEPRLRDNERRATQDLPLRGGPYTGDAAT